MAQETENKAKVKKGDTKIGAVIILIISAVVFLPAGGAAVYQGLFNHNKAPTFGSYDGKKVTYEPGSLMYVAASNIAQSYQRMGYQLNENSYYYIFNNAFQQTLRSMAFNGAVKKSGYVVPEDAVNREILPYFSDENGKFSPRLYNQADTSTITNLRENSEQSLLYSRYTSDIFGSDSARLAFRGNSLYGLKSTDKETAFIAELQVEQRSFNLVSFNTDDFPTKEAATYGQDNSALFQTFNVSLISVDDESSAKSILKQLKANEITFEDAVSEKSQKYYTSSEGKITSSYRYQVEDILKNHSDLESIEALADGELSSVIQTSHGYSIFRKDGPITDADFTSETVRKDVLSYMKSHEMGYIENFYKDLAIQFVSFANTNGFNRACTEFSLTKVNVDAFPLNYGNAGFYSSVASVSELSELSTNKEALKAAFSLAKDAVSEPLVMGKNIVVLQCTGIQNADAAESASVSSGIASTDQTSAGNTFMASPKVVDNFMSTYFSTFMK